MGKEILKLREISKSFGGVHALKNVDFSCLEGEVHCIAGENGAGKSTLLKIISGLYNPDSGQLFLEGKEVYFKNPQHAQEHGIAMVYQELTLIPEMTVAENIFLSIEPKKKLGLIDKKRILQDIKKLMNTYGIAIDPNAIVKNLPIAFQQMTEILKILIRDPKIIILDEPTSALAGQEVEKLFEIVKEMVKQLKTIIFISHRSEEIFSISDRITVLKDGEYIGTESIAQLDDDKLIKMMIGRSLTQIFPISNYIKNDKQVLAVNDLSINNVISNVSFEMMQGEVLGIAGLAGHGQTELLEGIAGMLKKQSGTIQVNGIEVETENPWNAMKAGISLVPIDRKTEGLFLDLSVRENLSITTLNKRQTGSIINRQKENTFLKSYVDKLSIKLAHLDIPVKNLSGGNQQKVVLGRQLAFNPKILLFNEPTRGIDIQAKSDFYHIMRELTESGIGVIIYSSELVEIIGMCDRVLVMYEGKITGNLKKPDITEESIMRCAVGL